MHRALLLLLGAALVASACSGSESSDPAAANNAQPDSGFTPLETGVVADTGITGTPEVGVLDAGFPDSGVAPAPKVCADLGLTPQPFNENPEGFLFGDVAGDFTVNQLDGTQWNLRENWTGCESYVFINYIFIPTRGSAQAELWRFVGRGELGQPPIDALIQSPLNAHYFFTSTESEGRRRDRVQMVKDAIEDALRFLVPDPVMAAAQRARFHYVVDEPADIEGSVGAFYTDYFNYSLSLDSRVDLGERGQALAPLPYFFGIDRDQKWDSGGSPDQAVGAEASMRMASYLPRFYNHKARIRDELAIGQGVQTIPLIDEEVTDRIFVRPAMLPSAQQMAGFDTMEFDVTVNCPHRNVFACSEWDRIARIQLCNDQECTERQEVVRWITPYWRRGERRWIMDASTLLGLFKDGGQQYFRIVMGPEWERATARDVRVSLRLSSQGRPDASAGAVFVYRGGGFNDTYNDREPVEFTVPETASRAELVLILSGHGQDGNTNCAEWCDHRHRFTVNGTELDEIRHVGGIGTTAIGGCGEAAAAGVSPGQFGNWAMLRAYWCPGLPVDHIRVDITPYLQRGQTNVLTYSANLAGQVGRVGNGNIDLSTYVVWYE